MNDFTGDDSILRIRQCGHIFREMNLRRHFRNSPRCPICRFDIRDYIVPENDYTNRVIRNNEQSNNENSSSINSESLTRNRSSSIRNNRYVSENFMNSLDRDILDLVEDAMNSMGNDPSGNLITTDIIYEFT